MRILAKLAGVDWLGSLQVVVGLFRFAVLCGGKQPRVLEVSSLHSGRDAMEIKEENFVTAWAGESVELDCTVSSLWSLRCCGKMHFTSSKQHISFINQ